MGMPRDHEKREKKKIKLIEKIMEDNPGMSLDEAYAQLRHQERLRVEREMVLANKEMVRANRWLMWVTAILVTATILFSALELYLR